MGDSLQNRGVLQSFSVSLYFRYHSCLPRRGPGCRSQRSPRAQGAAPAAREGCAAAQNGIVLSHPQADSNSHPLHAVNLLLATAKSLYSWKGKSGNIYLTVPVTFLGLFSHHIPPLSAFGQYSTNQLDPFKMLKEKARGRKGTCTSIYRIRM